MSSSLALNTGPADPVKTRGICLLSLDGGGVRVLSSLHILESLMEKVNRAREPEQYLRRLRPCDVFDVIGGTGTGGLAAIMLGRLKMDVTDCISEYTKISERILQKPRNTFPSSTLGWSSARFDGEVLRRCILELVAEFGQPEDGTHYSKLWDLDAAKSILFDDGISRGCHTIVCAMSTELQRQILFRDFSVGEVSKFQQATVLQVACATMATPMIFDPVNIEGVKFVDGGPLTNNPINSVYSEASRIWSSEGVSLSEMLKCIVSIGTGLRGPEALTGIERMSISKSLIGLATSTDRTDNLFIRSHKELVQPDSRRRYYRFNVEQGLETIGLDQFRQRPVIEEASGNYLRSMPASRLLRLCGDNLSTKESFTPSSFSNVILLLEHQLEPPTQILTAGTIEYLCHKVLRTSPYEEYKNIHPSRVPGSCRWFLEHATFLDWESSKRSNFLWVTADPGSGKSVLCRSLADDELCSTTTPPRTTCYFFFSETSIEQKSSTRALSALLHQLFLRRPDLIKYAIPDYQRYGSKLADYFYTLWDVLIKATADPTAGETICILDGLDECEENGRFEIVDALKSFYLNQTDTRKDAVLKFLVTSRPYFDLERAFTDILTHLPSIRLNGEAESQSISQEIDIIIRSRVGSLAAQLSIPNKERMMLENALLGSTHRTYLWVKLVLTEIEDSLSSSRSGLRQLLQHLPTTVEAAYGQMLERSVDKGRARTILHFVLGAVRPLTVQEMNRAFALQEPTESYSDLEAEESVASVLRDVCGLLISVIDSRIYLIHQTVREYLYKEGNTGGSAATHSESWKHSFKLEESSIILARTCLRLLLLDAFEKSPLTKEHPSKRNWHSYRVKLMIYADKHPFLQYAAANWPYHFNMAEKYDDKLGPLARSICNTHTPRFQMWFAMYLLEEVDPPPKEPSDLICAACCGLESLTRELLENNNVKLYSKANGKMAIHYAASKGHVPVLRQLISKSKAYINTGDDSSQSPLLIAAQRGHADAVELLLAEGAATETRDSYQGRTPLLWAAGNGHARIVASLLDNGADINATDLQESTAVILALQSQHDQVSSQLIDQGANLDLANKDDMTPLQVALKVFGAPDIRDYDPTTEPSLQGIMTPGAQAKTTVLKRRGCPVGSKEKDDFLLKKSFRLLNQGRRIKKLLIRERHLLWKLHHPNVVQFRHYEQDGQEGHLYMEFCTEGDLARYVDPDDSAYEEADDVSARPPLFLSYYERWGILSDIAAALAYCHYGFLEDEFGNLSLMLQWRSVIHRDIKPANVVHSRDEDGNIIAKICDLGLAKFFDDNPSMAGSFGYAPPELFKSPKWTTKGDIFCLGRTIQALNKTHVESLNADAREMQTADEEIERILVQCVNDDPGQRPSSLGLLQVSRTYLQMFPPSQGLPLRFSYASENLDYPLQTSLKYLERLFHSFKKLIPAERPDWSSRLLLYWVDFAKHIVWSEAEAAHLKVLLKRSIADDKRLAEEKQKQVDHEREKKGYDKKAGAAYVEPEVNPIVEVYLQGCRWNTYGLRPSDLEDLISADTL